jgi:hypothetical protein
MPDERDSSRHDEAPADIPDLRGVPLATVLGADDSALGRAVRKRLRDMNQNLPPWSAHGTTP